VDPDHTYNRPISEIDISPEGRVVHQRGSIRVFRVVHSDGNAEHWATNILGASEPDRKAFKDLGWNIEEYNRGIKQCCGIERCQGLKRNRPARSHFSFITGFSSLGNSAAAYGYQLVRVETLDSPNGNFLLYLATDFLIRFLFAGVMTGVSRFRLIQPRKSYVILKKTWGNN
jgi:hypothetical protein